MPFSPPLPLSIICNLCECTGRGGGRTQKGWLESGIKLNEAQFPFPGLIRNDVERFVGSLRGSGIDCGYGRMMEYSSSRPVLSRSSTDATISSIQTLTTASRSQLSLLSDSSRSLSPRPVADTTDTDSIVYRQHEAPQVEEEEAEETLLQQLQRIKELQLSIAKDHQLLESMDRQPANVSTADNREKKNGQQYDEMGEGVDSRSRGVNEIMTKVSVRRGMVS